MISKKVYIVLCLLFGFVGFHKFYANKKLIGVFYVLLCALTIFEPFFYAMILCLVVDLIEVSIIKSDLNGKIEL